MGQHAEVEHDDDGDEDLENREKPALGQQVGLAGLINELGDLPHRPVHREVPEPVQDHQRERQKLRTQEHEKPGRGEDCQDEVERCVDRARMRDDPHRAPQRDHRKHVKIKVRRLPPGPQAHQEHDQPSRRRREQSPHHRGPPAPAWQRQAHAHAPRREEQIEDDRADDLVDQPDPLDLSRPHERPAEGA